MREADVLVAAHGDELVYGFFLPRGAAVVEVRPHLLERRGHWSDAYASAYRADGAVNHYTLQLDASATLGAPQAMADGANLSAYDTYDSHLVCPRGALWRVLRRIASANGSQPRPTWRTLAARLSAAPATPRGEARDVQPSTGGEPYPPVAAATAAAHIGQPEIRLLPADPNFGARGLLSLKARRLLH